MSYVFYENLSFLLITRTGNIWYQERQLLTFNPGKMLLNRFEQEKNCMINNQS